MQAYRSRNQYLATVMAKKGCAGVPLVTDQQKREKMLDEAKRAGVPPNCKDVGGYESYMEQTGNVCNLGQ